jgi:hypothetical protein
VWLPARRARELLAGVLGSAEEMAGVVNVACTVYGTRRFRRPLFRVPDDEAMVAFWLVRAAMPNAGPSLEAQYAANGRFLARALATGVKRYPPTGGVATAAEWRVHCGDALHRRLVAAKRRYDPRGVLTPGPGIFA